MQEHHAEREYPEGCIVAGRLIPCPEIGWIRSPGSMIWSSKDGSRSSMKGNLEIRAAADTQALSSSS